MRIVVVMDPVETVLVNSDTSFALMLAAQERRHEVLHCLPRDLELDAGRVYAHVRPARMQRVAEAPIVLGERQHLCLHDVDAVLIRKDPPFDADYLWCTLILEQLRGETLVVNDPRGLREANEKLYACKFPELMPRTLVTHDKARIRDFALSVGGRAVLKPIGGARGDGVFVLDVNDLNFNAIVEQTTQTGRHIAMVQELLPVVSEGDKRVLLLNGEPLGALLRMPAKGDVRSNLAAGGSAVKVGVTEHERRLIEVLRPRLLADGLYFVGIDLIAGKLTEVNVTSPTGLQAMSRLDGIDYAPRVIEWLEKQVA